MSNELNQPKRGGLTVGKFALPIGILVVIGLIFVLFNNLFTTVESGTYQVKQAAVSGTMSAQMNPGMYFLFFGSNIIWPKAETFYFTADKDTKDDIADDMSIEVRFNDGSLARISGTVRIILPTDKEQAIALVTKSGYRSYASLKDKLILPVLRNALRNTANLMSARESYATHRSNYVNWSWDQIQNGIYETEEEVRVVADMISGEKIQRTYKVIKKDKSGNIVRGKNPLANTGIKLANFEVKQFKYSEAVARQIETQQKAFMAVATAAAEAKQAEQEKIKAKAEGEKRVMEAKYVKEQEKIKAVVDAEKKKEVAELLAKQDLEVAKFAKMKATVDAEKKKEVAELLAKQELEVAKFEKMAAIETKQKLILLGEGEAKRKRLVMQADGALKEKLDRWIQAQEHWARAYQNRAVPSYYVNGSGGSGKGVAGGLDMQTQQFMNFINAMMANQLGLDMKIKKK